MNDKQQSLIKAGVDRLETVIRPKTLTGGATIASILTLFKIPLGQQMLVEATVFASAGTERAAYKLTALIKNLGGTTALVGAVNVTAFEDDATWTVTLVANNTKDSIDLQVLPDDTNDTKVWGYASAVAA